MRELNTVEMALIAGGDDDNTTACQTAVGAATFVVGATYGLPAGAAAASLGAIAISTCEAVGDFAGSAIASGIAGAAEGIDAFGNSLADGVGALQMAAMRSHVNWFTVDGL